MRALRTATTGALTGCALLGCAICALTGCATPRPDAQSVAPEDIAPADPVALSPRGERYMKNLFLYLCAEDYLVHPGPDGPPLPVRAEARAKRHERMLSCMREVIAEYTRLPEIKMMTWNGRDYSMSPTEMEAIARFGGPFLEDYVTDLLEREQQREDGTSTTTASSAADPDPDRERIR